MNLKIKKWEIAGIIFIIGFGTTLHFWFEWTNYWRPMALIAAVNESTWEHFKMAFWPSIFFGIVEYFCLKINANKFLFGKLLGLITMPIVTFVLFYSYTTITGHHYLWVDVIIFMLSVIAGQYVSYKILVNEKTYPSSTGQLAMVGIVVMIAAFSSLSYYPMKNFIFEHPDGHGEYGILDHYGDHDH